jgi:glutamate racemase
MRAFSESVPAGVEVLNPAACVAGRFVDWLARHPDFQSAGSGHLRILSSGDVCRFAKHGARFLGAELPGVEHLAEANGRLTLALEEHEPLGQVMR